jgi:hypothetical protein
MAPIVLMKRISWRSGAYEQRLSSERNSPPVKALLEKFPRLLAPESALRADALDTARGNRYPLESFAL